MKPKLLILFLFCLAIFSACKKETQPDIVTTIIGQWQLQKQFNGYANGGDYRWDSVPNNARKKIKFQGDNTFIESAPPGLTPIQCTGTYTITPDNHLILNSACNQSPLDFSLTDITSSELELSTSVREGVIKQRFKKL